MAITLRERMTQLVGGPRYRQTQAAARAFQVAYTEAPYMFSPMDLLRELDQDTLATLIAQMQYEELGQITGQTGAADDAQRQRDVQRARRAFRYDALVNRAVRMWTSFGFGQTVTITATDPLAQPIWDAYWDSDANDSLLGERNLHKLSNRLLIDGELFFIFFVSKVDGSVRLRRIPTEQITALKTVPDDPDITCYYERRSTDANGTPHVRWYRDWRASDDEVETVTVPGNVLLASDENKATDVVMMQVAINSLEQRGLPLVTTGMPWADAYKSFLQNRLTLSRAVASFLEDVKVKGGSRATNAVRAALQSAWATGVGSAGVDTNPPPAAGSMMVHNEMLEFARKPLTTGAGDAQTDGMTILGQAAMGLGGMPSMWLGRPDAMQNRATAEATLMPVLREWALYQLLWRGVFEDMAVIVLSAAEQYPLDGGREFPDKSIKVTMDTPLDADATMVVDSLTKLFTLGILDARTATEVALRVRELGIADADAVLARMFPPKVEPGTLKVEPTTVPLAATAAMLRTLFTEARDGATTDAQRQAADAGLRVLAGVKGGENGDGDGQRG